MVGPLRRLISSVRPRDAAAVSVTDESGAAVDLSKSRDTLAADASPQASQEGTAPAPTVRGGLRGQITWDASVGLPLLPPRAWAIVVIDDALGINLRFDSTNAEFSYVPGEYRMSYQVSFDFPSSIQLMLHGATTHVSCIGEVSAFDPGPPSGSWLAARPTNVHGGASVSTRHDGVAEVSLQLDPGNAVDQDFVSCVLPSAPAT